MIQIVSQPISIEELKKHAAKVFGDMVKVVVDVEQQIMAINGELHADEEALLLQHGSKQHNLWGINLYPELYGDIDWLEYDSMINLRPSGGNTSRGVDDVTLQTKIRAIVESLVVESLQK